ncbi:MAG: ABC transporter substrate-binding protein [Treponema sp.]|nr:ABC transporter substrate-binding protein [Treponema sp.]
MKKFTLTILAGALLFGFGLQNVSAGGNAAASSTSSGAYKVTLAMITPGTIPDLALVQAEINKHISAKGLEVELLPLSFASYQDQINLMISGGEKLDLIPVFNSTFNNDVAQGKLLPITQYLKTTGAPIASVMGNEYLKAGTVSGEVYGIPSLRDMAASYGVCFRKDILEKYGFKVEDIKTVEDVGRVYETVSKGEPGMSMTYGQGNTLSIVAQLMVDWDNLGNDFGVLMNRGQNTPLRVVNLFDTPEYEQKVRIARDWYQKGYVLPDASTNSQGATTLVGAGQLFSFCSNLKPGFDMQSSLSAGGVEMVTATINPALSTTGQVGVLSWAVPITCKNPEKTIEFLSLMFTDPVLINLIDWGIEGRHYVKLNNQVITYPAGVNSSNTGYNLNLAWIYGNSLLAYVWEGNAANTNALMQEFNRSAIFSKGMGFQFDASPVRSALSAVTNVAAEYRLGLEYGMVDVDSTLPRFRRALEDAGINQIVAEKQRQLDAWIAGN